ncbi:MAG: NAD-dependent epimerase/dehydratase family protein, partial [Pseudomonadales bacterium]
MDLSQAIVITGGAGLVGQNLAIRLCERGFQNITVIDKHSHNLQVLKQVLPSVDCVDSDLAIDGDWQEAVFKADVIIMLQAQIGALAEDVFIRNNITATKNVLAGLDPIRKPYLLHMSSSVVMSVADDFYTRSKKA